MSVKLPPTNISRPPSATGEIPAAQLPSAATVNKAKDLIHDAVQFAGKKIDQWMKNAVTAGPSLDGAARESTVGRVSLEATVAQSAVEKSLQFLQSFSFAPGAVSFAPRSVDVEPTGQAHVRLDRTHEGLKVFGEQVITHLDSKGEVGSVTGNSEVIKVKGGQPSLSPDAALSVALSSFAADAKDCGGKPEGQPAIEHLIFKGSDGEYKNGYLVEVTNYQGGPKPYRMQYLVDGETGKVDDKWNQSPGFFDRAIEREEAAKGAAAGLLLFDKKIEKAVAQALSMGRFDESALNELLGLIGDRVGKEATGRLKPVSAKSVAAMLADPGLTRSQKFEAVAQGMTAHEKHDLEQVMNSGLLKLPAHQQNFVDALLGKTELKTELDLKDHRLALAYVETKAKGQAIDETTLPKFVHAIADKAGISAKDIEKALKPESTAKPDLIAKIQANMTKSEAKDLAALLDYQPLPMSPGAKNFLEALLKRATVDMQDDTTVYSGKVEIASTKQPDGTFKLEDHTRAKGGIFTRDAMNKSSASTAKDIADANDIWGEAGDPARDKASVDAHYGQMMLYDSLKYIGGDSIDDKGAALKCYVHVKDNYVNAYWDGSAFWCGDGDGKKAGPLTEIKVIAHEISHGRTQSHSNLIYRGESGGINEAMSDIIGMWAEFYAVKIAGNTQIEFTWDVGDKCWTPGKPGDALRYMSDPRKDNYSVDHFSLYPKQTEVHGSSGIVNNCAYLLAEGGVNRTAKEKGLPNFEVKKGIGVEKMVRIFDRAQCFYMTPSCTFRGGREATLKAAADLYGADSVEVATVKEAWDAVGVFEAPPPKPAPAPAPTPAPAPAPAPTPAPSV